MTWRLPDYTVIGRIGHGSTGTVTSARHEPTGAYVAIKFLSARRRGRSTPSDWFRSQVRLLAEVDDANVARLYEYIESPRGGALVMELVDGLPLDELIRRGPLEPQASLAILRGCLRGLAAAHAKGLLHRDFRPANVQIGRRGTPKIVDFGVVPPVESMRPTSGTPLYQAPELWDRRPADARTDLYAAAATFYECLTGRPPFADATTMAEMRTAHEEAPIALDAVPEPLRALVNRGLAKDPTKRPADAVAFLKLVENVAARRYGPEWQRAGEAVLTRRLLPIVSAPGGPFRAKPPRAAVAVVASSFATRLLAGAALVAAIVIGVASAVTASGPSLNTTASDGPGFTVVLPNGTGRASTSIPTAIPTLLIIPTPGVTLTAPPVRTTGPGGRAIGPNPLPPPPRHTATATTTPTPGGGTTTTPVSTPTAAPPSIQGATLTSFTTDGISVGFSINVTTTGSGALPMTVTITQFPAGTQIFQKTYTVPPSPIGESVGSILLGPIDCLTGATVSISANVALDSSATPATLSLCPASPAP